MISPSKNVNALFWSSKNASSGERLITSVQESEEEFVERIFISYWKSSDDDVNDAVDEGEVWLEDLSRRVGYVVFDDWFSESFREDIFGSNLRMYYVFWMSSKNIENSRRLFYVSANSTIRGRYDRFAVIFYDCSVWCGYCSYSRFSCSRVGWRFFGGVDRRESMFSLMRYKIFFTIKVYRWRRYRSLHRTVRKDGRKMTDINTHLRSRRSSVAEKEFSMSDNMKYVDIDKENVITKNGKEGGK